MSTSLQTTVAAEAYLAEGQFLLEEHTLNKAKYLMYPAGTRRPTFSKGVQHFKPNSHCCIIKKLIRNYDKNEGKIN
jgi:hypothetical protein